MAKKAKNNQHILFLLFLVAAIGAAAYYYGGPSGEATSCGSNYKVCMDSDGGGTGIIGTVTTYLRNRCTSRITGTYTEPATCTSATSVTEYACNQQTQAMYQVVAPCQYGCVNGVCLSAPATNTTPISTNTTQKTNTTTLNATITKR